MPSPFPGMDPWLERNLFGDLHSSLIYLVRGALNAAMPANYFARGSHLVWVDDELRREPDVGVFGRPSRRSAGRHTDEADGGGLATLAGAVPVAERKVLEPWEQPYLEIYDADGDRLVTVVEVVSRSNKRAGPGRVAYEQKQDECRLGGVHLVEIDLLRAGPHATAVPPADLRRAAGMFDYHVSIAVAGRTMQYYAVPFRLADRLPVVPVPLDPGVEPVRVDLQPLLDTSYDTGRYAASVRYHLPPDPPLTPEQVAWAADRLRAAGLLPATPPGG